MEPSNSVPTGGRSSLGEKLRALSHPRTPLAWLRLGIAVWLLLTVLGFAAAEVTSSPALCASCHEMSHRASEWAISPHANVKCVQCHVAAHPWYAFPQALLGQSQLLGRDVAKHFADPPKQVDSRPAGVAPMPDSICLQCHDPNRKPTAGLGILIDHPKHAKRNGSCISCHRTVAHPSPEWGTAVSFMQQCFTCHGQEKGAKAPGTCTLCHPADFKMKPETHDAKWKAKHGKIALTERKQCMMCHAQSFCDSCHGLQMPHPAGWSKASGHPEYAKRDSQVCQQCHGGQPDWCTMCHHKAYDPSRGTWVKQHFIQVEQTGASYCLQSCHSPVFCSNCHVGAPRTTTS